MPGAIVEAGLASEVLPISAIAEELLRRTTGFKREAKPINQAARDGFNVY